MTNEKRNLDYEAAVDRLLAVLEDWDDCASNEDGGQTLEQSIAEHFNWDDVRINTLTVQRRASRIDEWMLVTAGQIDRFLATISKNDEGCPTCGAHRPHDNAKTCATCCEELARVEGKR